MDSQHTKPVRSGGAVHRDRSLGLVVFGVLEILAGTLCALLVPMSLAAIWLSGGSGVGDASQRGTIPLMSIYLIIAALLIWIGIGSIRARRWACELMLSISKVWLVTGIGVVIVISAIFPDLLRSSVPVETLPVEAVVLATAVTLGVLSLFYIVLPGAILLFYRSPDVAATCTARDPGPQAIDGVPSRIVTLVVMWACAAVSVLAVPASNWVFPLFGVLLVGARGVVPWLVACVICIGLAYGSFLRRPWAWWGGMVATILAAMTTIVTALRVPPEEILLALELPDEYLNMLAFVARLEGWHVVMFLVALWGPVLVYLLSLRGFFDGVESAAGA